MHPHREEMKAHPAYSMIEPQTRRSVMGMLGGSLRSENAALTFLVRVGVLIEIPRRGMGEDFAHEPNFRLA